MTNINTRGRGGLLRLIGGWLGLGKPGRTGLDLDLVELEGLDGYLMRDIGLFEADERPASRDIFQ
ncbi:MAG: hypothetical protein VR78_17260 [Hoeflea sp. BRH_c9]|nr:MAG: hypothetical protein VR78_17260 [Hoeflea sp. BRH_c9]